MLIKKDSIRPQYRSEHCAQLQCRNILYLCASVIGWIPSDVLRSRVIVCIKGVWIVALSGNILLCTATYEVVAMHCNPHIRFTEPELSGWKGPEMAVDV